MDSFSAPINRRTESRVTSQRRASNSVRSKEKEKVIRKKQVIIKQKKSISYDSYKKNNIVKM